MVREFAVQRLGVSFDARELSILMLLARAQASASPRAHELHFRGYRARYAVARELGVGMSLRLAGDGNADPDCHFRGWGVRVRGCSATVGPPQLWFTTHEPQGWDAAVLVTHHPDVPGTAWLCGWLDRDDWLRMARKTTMFDRDVWAVTEPELRPFTSLLRAQARWGSL